MASEPMGRVIVSEGALPAVHVVPFALDRECVVFRTPPDSPLAKAALDTVVAFQTDRIDPTAHTGWTGTITGHASRIDDPTTLTRLNHLLPTPTTPTRHGSESPPNSSPATPSTPTAPHPSRPPRSRP
ncbi:pyridoxamine 5'-phosphate oxidase family protein [Embleya scabrispora]|uniref:pyridoxamine 5'-phosphate oxidase family protein n=1 Tax=Embleya scabrispora TaxID=159449 RepID=UPI0022867995|nr:pyridoxamine 5'-phosphate oxidase family protein [Embleya scabrispora]